MAINWKQRSYPIGTRVIVFGLTPPEMDSEGILLTAYDLDGENEHPRIRLDSGIELRGSECWWIPANEVPNASNEGPAL